MKRCVTKELAMISGNTLMNLFRLQKMLLLVGCAIGLMFLAGSLPAYADDVSVTTSFDCVGDTCTQSIEHQDKAPFKGTLTLTVTNSGTQSWGDFHFQIYSMYPSAFWSNPANVSFVTTGLYAPTYANGGTNKPLHTR